MSTSTRRPSQDVHLHCIAAVSNMAAVPLRAFGAGRYFRWPHFPSPGALRLTQEASFVYLPRREAPTWLAMCLSATPSDRPPITPSLHCGCGSSLACDDLPCVSRLPPRSRTREIMSCPPRSMAVGFDSLLKLESMNGWPDDLFTAHQASLTHPVRASGIWGWARDAVPIRRVR